MRYFRTTCKCTECPLRDETRVYGKGRKNSKIAFIGEAPSWDEIQQNEPLVGPAGKIFNALLYKSGIQRYQNWVTNILPCKLPDNNWQSYEAEVARKCCRNGIHDEIEWLKENGVKVIFTLGHNVTKYMGIEGTISKLRGSVFQTHNTIIIPTFHPAAITHMQRRRQNDGAIVTQWHVSTSDLEKGRDIVNEGWEASKEVFNLFPTLPEVLDFTDNCLKNNRSTLLAIDIETTGINAESSEIVVIGLAIDDSVGISIPFLKCGGDNYWNSIDKKLVKNCLQRLFISIPQLYQNSLFDVPYLRSKGFNIPWANIRHDTMVLHHILQPELPHNLEFIVSMYGKTPYWKEDFKGREGSILEMDDNILRTYNLRDCVVLHQVLNPMLKELIGEDLEDIYFNEGMKMLQPIDMMETTGVKIDLNEIKKLKATYKQKQMDLIYDLFEFWQLDEIFNLNSPDDLRYLLYSQNPGKFDKIKELKEYDIKTTTKKKPLKKNTKKYQTLLNLENLKTGTKTFILPDRKILRSTKTSYKSTTDKSALLRLRQTMVNRIIYIEKLKHKEKKAEEKNRLQQQLKWLNTYAEYKEVTKCLSTYLEYPTAKDGKVHTHYLIHGTATGRLSSSKPNLQNLPKKRKEFRNPFIADEGYILLSCDYSNLEVRILAYETHDKVLQKAFEEGINIHDENTKILFGLTPLDKTWELGRRAAKIFMFGGISYGGSDKEIHMKVATEVPELNLTLKDFQNARERYIQAHPAYGLWAENIKKNTLSTRVAVIFNGRKRYLFGGERDIVKQGLNTPIQGGAGAIINQAMIRIVDYLIYNKLRSKLIMQVHDQLIMHVADGELSIIASLMKNEMERKVNYKNEEVIFPIDFEIGKSFGKLKEINYKELMK